MEKNGIISTENKAVRKTYTDGLIKRCLFPENALQMKSKNAILNIIASICRNHMVEKWTKY